MSHFTKLSSRGGVQAKSLLTLILPIILSITALAVFSLPAFASGSNNNSGQTQPTVSHVTIDGDNIYYPEGFDQNTAKYENKTLTLENYNDGPIEISYVEGDVTIMLKGKNTITTNEDNGIYSRANLIIDGDGELEINAHDYGIELSYGQVLTINGGTTKILGYDNERHGGGQVGAQYFLMNGGTLNVSGWYSGSDAVFVQNGGESSFRSLKLGEKGVFNQNGGELTVNEDDERIGEGVALSVAFAVFNGGNVNITSAKSAGMVVDGESSLPSFDLDKVGAVLPKNGASVEFNGGDITFSGGMMPFMIAFDNGYDEQITYVNISENMNIDPSYAKVVKVMLDTGGGGPLSVMGLAYSDGADEIGVDMENMAFLHALKSIHFYKNSVPVPATDDEENPNTLDTKIIALAFGVLASIIAEGIIIADLYRRLFGYKQEAAAIEQEIAKSEPSEPETPEEPKSPEEN